MDNTDRGLQYDHEYSLVDWGPSVWELCPKLCGVQKLEFAIFLRFVYFTIRNLENCTILSLVREHGPLN